MSGRTSGGGLWYGVRQDIQDPTLTAYRGFLIIVMIPYWMFLGGMIMLTETFSARR